MKRKRSVFDVLVFPFLKKSSYAVWISNGFDVTTGRFCPSAFIRSIMVRGGVWHGKGRNKGKWGKGNRKMRGRSTTFRWFDVCQIGALVITKCKISHFHHSSINIIPKSTPHRSHRIAFQPTFFPILSEIEEKCCSLTRGECQGPPDAYRRRL